MSVYEAVNAGEYKPTMPLPARVEKPAILRKRVDELSHDDMMEAVRAKAKYEADVASYTTAMEAYRKESGELEIKFQRDLEVENGVSGHPRAGLLYQLAYDRGHSSGMGEVALYYSEMADLIVGTKLVSAG